MNVIAYDFDGTITKKDTFLDFSMYSKGKFFTILSLCLYSPLIILAKLRLYSNGDVKQKVFSFLYKGMSIASFNQKCVEYANYVSDEIIKEDALRSIRVYLPQDKVVIITASILNWVKPIAEKIGINEIIATEIECDDLGIITGKFKTPNCYGKEKVKRLLESYPNRKAFSLVAFGDSRGDSDLLEFADEKYYKCFQV